MGYVRDGLDRKISSIRATDSASYSSLNIKGLSPSSVGVVNSDVDELAENDS